MEAKVAQHIAHLAVLALADRERDPHVRCLLAIERRIDCAVADAVDGHALAQRIELFLRDLAVRPHDDLGDALAFAGIHVSLVKPGLTRPSTSFLVAWYKDVDARHKAGHDGVQFCPSWMTRSRRRALHRRPARCRSAP